MIWQQKPRRSASRDHPVIGESIVAMRTSWGREPGATVPREARLESTNPAERLALYVTNRSFWGRGAIGSEPATQLLALPMVDRLALEMAAHEDSERRAMEGELAELEEAWREAEEMRRSPIRCSMTRSWRRSSRGCWSGGSGRRRRRSGCRGSGSATLPAPSREDHG